MGAIEEKMLEDRIKDLEERVCKLEGNLSGQFPRLWENTTIPEIDEVVDRLKTYFSEVKLLFCRKLGPQYYWVNIRHEVVGEPIPAEKHAILYWQGTRDEVIAQATDYVDRLTMTINNKNNTDWEDVKPCDTAFKAIVNLLSKIRKKYNQFKDGFGHPYVESFKRLGEKSWVEINYKTIDTQIWLREEFKGTDDECLEQIEAFFDNLMRNREDHE